MTRDQSKRLDAVLWFAGCNALWIVPMFLAGMFTPIGAVLIIGGGLFLMRLIAGKV